VCAVRCVEIENSCRTSDKSHNSFVRWPVSFSVCRPLTSLPALTRAIHQLSVTTAIVNIYFRLRLVVPLSLSSLRWTVDCIRLSLARSMNEFIGRVFTLRILRPSYTLHFVRMRLPFNVSSLCWMLKQPVIVNACQYLILYAVDWCDDCVMR